MVLSEREREKKQRRTHKINGFVGICTVNFSKMAFALIHFYYPFDSRFSFVTPYKLHLLIYLLIRSVCVRALSPTDPHFETDPHRATRATKCKYILRFNPNQSLIMEKKWQSIKVRRLKTINPSDGFFFRLFAFCWYIDLGLNLKKKRIECRDWCSFAPHSDARRK